MTDPLPSDDRRLSRRDRTAALKIAVDCGDGPREARDWSLGGARLAGPARPLAVGDVVTGTVLAGGAGGPFIADVVRTDPPHFDPQRPPDEVSLRWLDLPDAVLAAMIAALAGADARAAATPPPPHQETPDA